jgi:hypothetical protein
MKRRIIVILAVILVVLILNITMNWLSFLPSSYLDDIEDNYSGLVIDKYFLKDIHLKIKKDDNIVIDVANLSQELIEICETGDSIVKFVNSNCCEVFKDSNSFILSYKYIPPRVLERDKYLKDIIEKKCDQYY